MRLTILTGVPQCCVIVFVGYEWVAPFRTPLLHWPICRWYFC